MLFGPCKIRMQVPREEGDATRIPAFVQDARVPLAKLGLLIGTNAEGFIFIPIVLRSHGGILLISEQPCPRVPPT